ncbi:tyrosine-type recombinase/integrase [Streptomyces sp. NPDC005774]|uniref:tyrosine-type recombinase/integrase n=1 Tax=Streptomyces sp. NPDC005774 TaxID=3364728 RepID=UPI0036B68E0F
MAETGGAHRVPRARVVSLAAGPGTYAAAMDRYLTAAGISKGSARVYRISLTNWAWMLAGRATPTGPARRGARPPALPLSALDDEALPALPAELAAARADELDADTVNRELSVIRKAIGWWRRQGWIACDPTYGIERRPAPPDKPKALSLAQVAAVWRLGVGLRERTLWRLLYESAARAEEALCLNIEDLFTADKRGKVTAKGGATEWIHWQSGTAQLLPRLIAGRTEGPLFLTERRAPAGTPTLDICPTTGRARLPVVIPCGDARSWTVRRWVAVRPVYGSGWTSSIGCHGRSVRRPRCGRTRRSRRRSRRPPIPPATVRRGLAVTGSRRGGW